MTETSTFALSSLPADLPQLQSTDLFKFNSKDGKARYGHAPFYKWLRSQIKHLENLRCMFEVPAASGKGAYLCTIYWGVGGVDGRIMSDTSASLQQAAQSALSKVMRVPAQKRIDWVERSRSLLTELGINDPLIKWLSDVQNDVPVYSVRASWLSVSGEKVVVGTGAHSMMDDAYAALLCRASAKLMLPIDFGLIGDGAINWAQRFTREGGLIGARPPIFTTRRTATGDLEHSCHLSWEAPTGGYDSVDSELLPDRESAYQQALMLAQSTAVGGMLQYELAVKRALANHDITHVKVNYEGADDGTEKHSIFKIQLRVYGANWSVTSHKCASKKAAFSDAMTQLQNLISARERIGQMCADMPLAFASPKNALLKVITTHQNFWRNEWRWLQQLPNELEPKQELRMATLASLIRHSEEFTQGDLPIYAAPVTKMLDEVTRRQKHFTEKQLRTDRATFLRMMAGCDDLAEDDYLDDYCADFLNAVGKRGLHPDDVLDDLEARGLITTESNGEIYVTQLGASLVCESQKAIANKQKTKMPHLVLQQPVIANTQI